MKSIQKKINYLRTLLLHHQYQYHTLDDPEISDADYDKLMLELQCLEKTFSDTIESKMSPTKRVGATNLDIFETVKHESFMLSLANVFNETDVLEFVTKIKARLNIINRIPLCCELKFDGLAINLIYKHGFLIRAVTRGDGTTGENVTNNIRTIPDIPHHIKMPITNRTSSQIEIRGEVFMTKSRFEQLNQQVCRDNKKIFANPRNAAAGSVRQIDPKVTANRFLSFYSYGVGVVTGFKKPDSHFLTLRKLKHFGMPICDYTCLCFSLEEIMIFYHHISHLKSKLDFDIDGIVIKVDSHQLQNRLGNRYHVPRWAVALKFPATEKLSYVQNIKFQVGRTGVITPVAQLQPVEVDGIVVSHATLHNFNEIKRLNLYLGDQVVVRRAGNVVPQIVKVNHQAKPLLERKKIILPSHCPVCHSKLENINQVLVRCTGGIICSSQKKHFLKHFVSRRALNIKGLGDRIIDQLVNNNYVSTPADLFGLNIQKMETLDNMGAKLSLRIITAVRRAQNTTLSRFIYSLGIREVGVITALNLAHYFGSWQRFVSADFKTFLKIKNIGPIVAAHIINFLSEKRNKIIIRQLVDKLVFTKQE
ncbi:MAG: NAD-dependent DNA ligase LigA [Candidatus Dasytiphilus stammeri]